MPLAVQRATGGLTFAGDAMSDYRDVLALDEHRRDAAVTRVKRLVKRV